MTAIITNIALIIDLTTTFIFTHNSALVPIANRVIHINDAKVQKIEENPHPKSIDELVW